MSRDEIRKKIQAAEKELEYLKAQLDAIPDHFEWETEHDKTWWHMDRLLLVTNFTDYDTPYNFNMFHTAEYAQEFADHCTIIGMLLHCKWYLDRDYVPRWSDLDERKYCVVYDSLYNKYVIDFAIRNDNNNVYFSSEDTAQRAADWMNEHIIVSKKG